MAKFFSDDSLKQFATLYPKQSGLLSHNCQADALFQLPRLVALANTLPRQAVEYNRADVDLTLDPEATPDNGLDVIATIRSIEENNSWLVLKNIEQDPEYRALLDGLIDELEPSIRVKTGKTLRREAFVFVSSPHAITPFHMDPEHNILLQIRGSKTMYAYPADDPEIVSPEQHEAYHGGGHRNLVHKPSFDEKAIAHRLSPGMGVVMPVKAPHWVKVGDEVSISLSITWRSYLSVREADIRCMNHFLRHRGHTPMPVGANPLLDRVKAIGWRVKNRLAR